MRLASFDISSTPEDQYQTFGARTDVLALRMTLSQLSQQDLIGYDTASAQVPKFQNKSTKPTENICSIIRKILH